MFTRSARATGYFRKLASTRPPLSTKVKRGEREISFFFFSPPGVGGRPLLKQTPSLYPALLLNFAAAVCACAERSEPRGGHE